MIGMRSGLIAIVVAVLTIAGAPAGTAATPDVLPYGNGTWAYDSTHPGQWAAKITGYNASAGATHDISAVMSYATDLEMYCPDDDPAQCTPDDFYSYYTPGSNGRRSTAAYANQVPGAVLSPIVDGAVGSDYLAGFDDLSIPLARAFADKVAAQVCADPHVAGIQFDLEPFDVTTRGQYWFYRGIADAFAGDGCVDATHPQGRFFSVFTFANSIRPGTLRAGRLAAIVSAHHNGYVIDSLYDLGTRAGGWLNSPNRYATLVSAEVTRMRTWADRLDIPYGFGLPGGASAHEYSSCTGTPCRHDPGDETGYPMLAYTSRAVAAVDASGARDDQLFLGNDVWYFGAGPQHHGTYTVTPAPLPAAVLSYLATRL
jgi:hypothetical protein